MHLSSALLRFLVTGFVLFLGFHAAGLTQPLTKTLTPEQKEKLKERDRFERESAALEREGKVVEAIAAAQKMLALERELFGDAHEDIVGSLKRLSRMHERLEDFAAAGKTRQEVLVLQTKLHGDKAWQVTDARLERQHTQTLKRMDVKARQELKESEQWMEKAIANNKPGQYQQGAEFAAKALDVRIRLLGPDHQLAGLSAAWTGFLWDDADQLKKARPFYEQALAIHKKTLGDNHPSTVASLNNLGTLLQNQGNHAAARPYFEEALAISKKFQGDNHPNTAHSLNNLGFLLQSQGDHAAARPYYEQALAIYKKVLGGDHPNTATSLNNLGILLKSQGDYAAARPYYEQALAIRKKVLGDNHPQTATSLNNLGILLKSQGDYVAARPYYEQALAIHKKVLGDNHSYTASSLNNLGGLLDSQGDYAAARSFYEQALAIRKKVLGEKHPDTADSLNNLGVLLQSKGEYAAARPYCEQALAIRKEVLGDTHLDTAASLHNLGVLLYYQGDLLAARSHFEQALAIHKKVLGNNHPETAESLNSLGGLLQSQGEYGAARPYCEQALAIRKKVLGEKHPATAASLTNLGFLLQRQGDYAAARPYCEQALAISRSSLDLSALAQSERQQLLMGANLRYQFHTYLRLPCDTDANTASAYTQVLAWKGSVLARQQRLRMERQHPQLAPLLTNLRITSQALANLAFAVPDPKKRDVWSKQLEGLSERKEKLERDLADKSQAFRKDKELQNLTAKQLLQSLPADTALVDFLVYSHCQADPKKKGLLIYEERLIAFVLKPGSTVVRLELGPMAPIEKAIDLWRARTKERTLADADHPGMQLRRQLWLPLQKHLAGAKIVLISPDGALGRLPFAALPGSKEGSYLLEEVALSVIPVPRLLPDLLDKDSKEAKVAKPSLLLVGDVDFDAAVGKASPDGRVAATGERTGKAKLWKRLPATLGEILVIERHFKKRFKGAAVESLSEDQATEANLRELASQYSYLHLATHGFFASASVRSALAGDTRESSSAELFGQQGVSGFHPGLLSGLVLAGANKPPEPGQSDGILTALEVAELDLTKVELAVLSACETGLGKEAAGEGLLGLQRAFQVAGAKSVVASLWSVDDEATRKLMERFYENLWQKKMTRQESLRQAQLAMLRGELGRGFVPEEQKQNPCLPPHFWAAFVISGDWR